MKPLKYEDQNFEVLVQKHLFIKDKNQKNYYRNCIDSIDSDMLKKFEDYPEKVSLVMFWIYIFFTVIMIIFNNAYVFYLQKNVVPKFDFFIITFISCYFLFNIVLHELGHIKSLNYFGKSIDKVGFKLNFYVFPAFYVQMNETYMLSKIDKIIVHSFGLFINFTLINLIQMVNVFTFDYYPLKLAFMLFSSTLLWNLVPILNSDGYKILLATLSMDEFSKFTKNHWVILIFQIIGVGIALNTLVHWIFYLGNYFYE
ncbi:peptidase [Mammaliicoccus sciuri]|uniref:peptidase n=1 Tax=Mammaliicoccus sciuri TaxID=1296 RepID=UPI001E2B0F29|nr:peptidase [Mammaliicoccus sciuri]MCD8875117.1 peptidase [Mammaliicoccus sciuri]